MVDLIVGINMVDSGMRIQLRHWCSRLPAAHRLLRPDTGGTMLSATSQTHCWRLKCSLIRIHLRLASRRGNWIGNSFTIRAQALFRKCVLRRQNGSFSYMNRPSCKVQVGFEKAQPPHQVRIDDVPQAESIVFHICFASLECIRPGSR